MRKILVLLLVVVVVACGRHSRSDNDRPDQSIIDKAKERGYVNGYVDGYSDGYSLSTKKYSFDLDNLISDYHGYYHGYYECYNGYHDGYHDGYSQGGVDKYMLLVKIAKGKVVPEKKSIADSEIGNDIGDSLWTTPTTLAELIARDEKLKKIAIAKALENREDRLKTKAIEVAKMGLMSNYALINYAYSNDYDDTNFRSWNTEDIEGFYTPIDATNAQEAERICKTYYEGSYICQYGTYYAKTSNIGGGNYEMELGVGITNKLYRIKDLDLYVRFSQSTNFSIGDKGIVADVLVGRGTFYIQPKDSEVE
jgi:hypothetical protein